MSWHTWMTAGWRKRWSGRRSPASGWLFFNNRPVALYQQLTREELEQLVFVPHEAYETARVALILQCPESPYAVVQIATGKTGSFAENPA